MLNGYSDPIARPICYITIKFERCASVRYDQVQAPVEVEGLDQTVLLAAMALALDGLVAICGLGSAAASASMVSSRLC